MKKILIYLLAVVIVVVLAVVFFFDGLTKSALESYAQKVLKTPVSIAEFRSDLSDRKINLDFIEVKNPETFKNENAFVLNHLSATIDTESKEDLIILEQLEFDGLLFTLEQNNKQVNLVVLLKNLEQTSMGSSNSIIKDKSSQTNQKTEAGSEARVIIKDLKFINTQLNIDTQWFKDTVEVPDVVIRNFGAPNGIPINHVGPELMKIALRRIQEEVENKGLRLNEKEIKEGVRRKLEGELEELKGKLNNKAKGFFKKLGL